MSEKTSDHDFFYTNIHHFFNDNLSESDQRRFSKLLESKNFSEEVSEFKKKRGFLQIQLQAVSLTDQEKSKIRSVAIDEQTIDAVENAQITELSTNIDKHNFLVKIFFTVGVLAIAGIIGYPIVQEKSPRLRDPLNIIAYETLAFEQDNKNSRVSYPSDNNKDISDYFLSHPDLDFHPAVLNQVPKGFTPAGAAIIDYEIAKLSVAIYRRSKMEKVFLFSFYGDAKKLSLGNHISTNSRNFYTLASDRLNLVVWQANETTISALVSRESMENIVSLAKSSTKM